MLVMCVNKNAEYETIANEIDALREKKAVVVTKDAEQEMLRKRINEMRHFLQTQTNRVTEYDEKNKDSGGYSRLNKLLFTSSFAVASKTLYYQE